MNERQQITYMQIRIVRRAAENWQLSLAEVTALFDRYRVLEYMEENFGLLHLEGDEAVFEDVCGYLRNKGAAV